jgi:hypothetical protein
MFFSVFGQVWSYWRWINIRTQLMAHDSSKPFNSQNAPNWNFSPPIMHSLWRETESAREGACPAYFLFYSMEG